MSDPIFSGVQRYKNSGDFFCATPWGCKFVIRNPDNAPAPHIAVKFQHGHPSKCRCPPSLKTWRVDHKRVFDNKYAARVSVVWPGGTIEDPNEICGIDFRRQGQAFERWLDTAFYIVGCKNALRIDVPLDDKELPVVELLVHDGEDDLPWYELRAAVE